VKASRPPADAPIPTMGNPCRSSTTDAWDPRDLALAGGVAP